MTTPTDNKVSDFLFDLRAHAPNRHQIVMTVREIILNQDVGFDESLKYGGLVYQKEGALLMGLFAYKEHVSLEFGNGTGIEDVYSVLEGKGKYRRHIKFHQLSDVAEKHVKHYISAASNG